MNYIKQRNSLENRIYATRDLFDSIRIPSTSLSNLVFAFARKQSRYMLFTIANYSVVAIELIVLQCYLSIFAETGPLQVLRILSFLSLLPLFIFLTLGKKNPPDSLITDRVISNLSYKAVNISASRIIFIIKTSCAFLISGILISSKAFVESTPDVIQAIILTRLLTAPWDSVIGLLFLRSYKIINTSILTRRSFSIVFDLSLILLLVLHQPLLYVLAHVLFRIVRARIVIKNELDLSLQSFFIYDIKQASRISALARVMLKSMGLPFLIAVVLELVFFQLTRPVVILGPLYAQLIFLVHIYYHAATIVLLRFLRPRFDEFRQLGKFYNLKSRLLEYAFWQKSCLITILISAPVALISALPFIFNSALSPSGSIETLPKYIYIWPVFVGFSHSLAAVFAASTINRSWKTQFRLFKVALISLLIAQIIIYFIEQVRIADQNLFSISLLSDSLLHMIVAILGSLYVLRAKEENTKTMIDLALEKQNSNNYQLFTVKWRKGVTDKAGIITKALQNLKYQQIRVRRDKYCLLFPNDQKFALTDILKVLAPFIENIKHDPQFGTSSFAQGLSAQSDNADITENKSLCINEGNGFDLSVFRSVQKFQLFIAYLYWASKHGFNCPLDGYSLNKKIKTHRLLGKFAIEFKNSSKESR